MAEDKQNGLVKYTASDGSEVKLSPAIVNRYIVTGGQHVDDREVFAFMAKCQARGLNPLAGDAYMTAFLNRATGRVEASVIVSKDYFTRTANQQPTFDGMKAGVVVVDRTGALQYREGCIVGRSTEKLVGGWAEVYDKRRSHPSRAEVSLDEYDQHRSLWKTKPATMIRKVALVQALREAYPGAYGGIYDSSEMPERPAQAFVPEPDAQAAPVEAPALDEPPAEYYADAPAEPEPAPAEAPAQPDAVAVADEDYDF
ncbi:phage recombination protein Bet [Paratractidigestivibacter sp.]|uniref:phage recombination protein Bet n=1 Tax=Paratractidigestivibacter sp. TaxID=2847316 RepID=UPI003A931A44